MDEDTSLLELCVEEQIVRSLCTASNTTTLEDSLTQLTEVSRTEHGRSELASDQTVATVIRLLQSLPYPSARQLLVQSLRLLRNLCAGEILNQNLFVELNGVGAVMSVFRSARVCSSSEADCVILRAGLQVIANVSLAGEDHRRAIWSGLFPQEILGLAKIRSREICDPLCMVIYTCCEGYPGSPIAREILKTTSSVGFGDDWFKLVISRMCLEQTSFSPLFSELSPTEDASFSPEQAFLMRTVSEIFNERLEERDFSVSADFSDQILGIFKSSVVTVVGSGTAAASETIPGLPTGSAEIDVLGYSLTILRDICAGESQGDSAERLISSGLVDLLLSLLRDLDPNRDSMLPCLYKGFRRDIVAVIGNCAYGRRKVQDEIRRSDSILLVLQQCVSDENNPFLREWGIWAVRNLLERNAENQSAVAELEIRGAVDTPQLAGLGLRVEIDPGSGRPRLVNIPGMN